MKRKALLIASILLNALLVGFFFFSKKIPASTPKTPFRNMHLEFFDSFPIQPGDTVMLGDSITAAGPWNDLFPNAHIRNRGIGGDTIAMVQDRLQELEAAKPRKIFLLIGVNDLFSGRTIEDTVRDYTLLVDRLQKALPQSQLILQSLLPLDHRTYGGQLKNDAIRKLNSAIQKLAAERKLFFLDLYTPFLENGGSDLNRAYNYDGIHLTAKGYLKWKELIASHVGNPIAR